LFANSNSWKVFNFATEFGELPADFHPVLKRIKSGRGKGQENSEKKMPITAANKEMKIALQGKLRRDEKHSSSTFFLHWICAPHFPSGAPIKSPQPGFLLWQKKTLALVCLLEYTFLEIAEL